MRLALIDPRLSEPGVRCELQRRAAEAGWSEVGGTLIRDMSGAPVDRTKWLPRAPWYARMQQEPQARIPGGRFAVERAVALALAGEPMNPQERRSVVWMLNDHEIYAAWREQEEREASMAAFT